MGPKKGNKMKVGSMFQEHAHVILVNPKHFTAFLFSVENAVP